MNTGFIDNIDIKTTRNTINISSNSFNKFYIANLDNNGDEINYLYNTETNNLFANFFLLKIIKNKDTFLIYEQLLENKNIISIKVNFVNGASQVFELPKKRIIQDKKLDNIYEYLFDFDDNELGIIISDLNLKYKKELFI